MQAKKTFYVIVFLLGAAGVYLVSIGGFSFSPQTVTMSLGSTRTVANGRAQMIFDEAGTSVDVAVWCSGERRSLELDYEGNSSEEVCGIRVSVVGISEGRMGAPQGTFKIVW